MTSRRRSTRGEAPHRRDAAARRADRPARRAFAVELAASGTGVTRPAHDRERRAASRGRFAPWALTVARPGGTALIPNPHFAPQPEALLPARTLALWRYTDLRDARFAFGEAFVRLRCDPASREPNKIGVACERGWFAYLVDGTAFVHPRARTTPSGDYPDRGCSVEVYTQGAFCEVETLAPLVDRAAGRRGGHVERWSLVRDVGRGDDASLARELGEARRRVSDDDPRPRTPARVGTRNARRARSRSRDGRYLIYYTFGRRARRRRCAGPGVTRAVEGGAVRRDGNARRRLRRHPELVER